MTLTLKPQRGGFLRPFGCGWFIREFLLGNSPYESPMISPSTGAPQADILRFYKIALIKTTALDRATRAEEEIAKREKRFISPDNIEKLTKKYISLLPYKAKGCRYHSFVVYFSNLQRLGWVDPSGKVEPSAFQDNYPSGYSRIYFRLTPIGIAAPGIAWANPLAALYGKRWRRQHQ